MSSASSGMFGPSSGELNRFVGCLYTSLVVAHGLCSLPFVQSFGLMFGCLHALDHQRNVVVGFYFFDVSTVLDEI